MTEEAYIARRICLDPRCSEDAMAKCRRRRFRGTTTCGRPRTAGLHLAAELEAGHVAPAQLFSIRGWLWVGAWPVRVHFECTAWSRTESELCLRPARLTWPVGSGMYARAAVAVLEDLAAALQASLRTEASVRADTVVEVEPESTTPERRIPRPSVLVP
jgi:hypothetical protein